MLPQMVERFGRYLQVGKLEQADIRYPRSVVIHAFSFLLLAGLLVFCRKLRRVALQHANVW